MKVVFITSPHKKTLHQDHYSVIVNLLENLGHTVSRPQSYPAMLHAIGKSTAVLIEMSQPSTTAGYFIAQALKKEKPVLAVSSKFISHLVPFLEKSDLFMFHQYRHLWELKEELPFLISQIELKKTKKFNMCISAELSNYLTIAAKKHKLSKSDYIRQLLEKDSQRLL